jgi:hypothetical protein
VGRDDGVLDRRKLRNGRPGVNFIKLFSFVTDNNKLEGLSLETLFSQVIEFEGKAGANPLGVPFRCFLG